MLRFICHALLSFPFVGGRGHYSFQNQFLFSDSFSIGCDYSHFSVVVLGVRLLAFLYLFSLFFVYSFPLSFSLSYIVLIPVVLSFSPYISSSFSLPSLSLSLSYLLCSRMLMQVRMYVRKSTRVFPWSLCLYICVYVRKCDHISTAHVCKQSLAFFKHKTIQTFVYLNPVYYPYPEQEVERLRSVTLQPFICSKSLSVRNLSQKWSERLIWVPFYRSGFVYKGRRDWQ